MVNPIAKHWGGGRKMVERAASIARTLTGTYPVTAYTDLLAPLDNLHGGGKVVTDRLLHQMSLCLPPSSYPRRGLDLGSGFGGPARRASMRFNSYMDCVDITPEHVDIASDISRLFDRNNLEYRCQFMIGDVCHLDLGYEEGLYDFAMSMAVSCNIVNRQALYDTIRRALLTGGVVGFLDIVKGPTDGLVLPVPWSRDGGKKTSCLLTADETVQACATAGLELSADEDVSEQVLEWFRTEGLRATFGELIPDWPTMVANQIANLERGHIQFMIMIFRKE